MTDNAWDVARDNWGEEPEEDLCSECCEEYADIEGKCFECYQQDLDMEQDANHAAYWEGRGMP